MYIYLENNFYNIAGDREISQEVQLIASGCMDSGFRAQGLGLGPGFGD